MWLLTEKWNGEKTEGFFTDSKRLKAGEPLAYIIGYIPFLDTTIYLDSHPLIPRVETEYWVEHTIREIKIKYPNEPMHILDLCAGSGCIGIAILHAFPFSQVDFVELETKHHATIRKSIIENDIDLKRIQIIESDLFDAVPQEEYTYILTNPPYINQSLNRTQNSVHLYEPHRALYSDKNGFDHIERILRGAEKYLTKNGSLVIEHEPEHTMLIYALGDSLGYTTQTEKDQYDHERFTYLTRKA